MTKIRAIDENANTTDFTEPYGPMKLWEAHFFALPEDFETFGSRLAEVASDTKAYLEESNAGLAGFRYTDSEGNPELTVYTHSHLSNAVQDGIFDILVKYLGDLHFGSLVEMDMELEYPPSEGWIHDAEPTDLGFYTHADNEAGEDLYLKRLYDWVLFQPGGYTVLTWEEISLEIVGAPFRQLTEDEIADLPIVEMAAELEQAGL